MGYCPTGYAVEIARIEQVWNCQDAEHANQVIAGQLVLSMKSATQRNTP